MSDQSTTVQELKEAVRRFAAARGWDPYHSPKNLAMALAVEAAELMEHFLWVTEEESRRLVREGPARGAIADELADVAGLVLQFSRHSGIDVSEAVREKLRKNEAKYPAPTERPGGGEGA